MIDAIMHRMTVVEGILESANSEWARAHWKQQLDYFRRQLVKFGAKV